MSILKINYSHPKEHVLKDILGYIGADCWRVSVLDAANKEIVLYDHYLDDSKNNQIRDLMLTDLRFLQSLLEGRFKIVCEFFYDKAGGIITFSLEGQEIVYTSSNGRIELSDEVMDAISDESTDNITKCDNLTKWSPE
jgi:hypothetical protein